MVSEPEDRLGHDKNEMKRIDDLERRVVTIEEKLDEKFTKIDARLDSIESLVHEIRNFMAKKRKGQSVDEGETTMAYIERTPTRTPSRGESIGSILPAAAVGENVPPDFDNSAREEAEFGEEEDSEVTCRLEEEESPSTMAFGDGEGVHAVMSFVNVQKEIRSDTFVFDEEEGIVIVEKKARVTDANVWACLLNWAENTKKGNWAEIQKNDGIIIISSWANLLKWAGKQFLNHLNLSPLWPNIINERLRHLQNVFSSSQFKTPSRRHLQTIVARKREGEPYFSGLGVVNRAPAKPPWYTVIAKLPIPRVENGLDEYLWPYCNSEIDDNCVRYFLMTNQFIQAVENALIAIYIRKKLMETAKNKLNLVVDSNMGDLASLEYILGALVSKGDITASMLSTLWDLFCFNIRGNAADGAISALRIIHLILQLFGISIIRIDSRGPYVMWILSRLNEYINEGWISDKTCFFCDGVYEIIAAVSYCFDREYYDSPEHLKGIGGIDIGKYIAGGIDVFNLEAKQVKWSTPLELSADSGKFCAYIYSSPTVDLDELEWSREFNRFRELRIAWRERMKKVAEVNEAFPNFHLEDKVKLKGRGVDRTLYCRSTRARMDEHVLEQHLHLSLKIGACRARDGN